MKNPEQLSPRIIYDYDRKANETWNMREYKVPRQYQDPLLEVKKRQWAVQKKGEPNKKYVTKKGFYMDYPLNVAKIIPGSNKHGENRPWSFEKEAAISKHRKKDPTLIKYTYLERIEMEQKNRKAPGVCAYSLQKSLKEKDAIVKALSKKKKFEGDKHFFYDDTEFLSNRGPGAGNYNPHDKVRKIRKNKTVYKQWIKKHKSEFQQKNKRQSLIPAPGTYSPLNCTFTTFDAISKSPPKKKQIKDNFGTTDSRFPYTRPDKKKVKEIRPSPDSYNTMIEWKGKGSPKKREWFEAISKGFSTINIYH